MLALPPVPGWNLRAEADETGVTQLLDRDGRERLYAELKEEAGDRYLAELGPDVWNLKYRNCMDAISRLGRDITELEPDLLLIVGDDQEELFSRTNNPSIAISYAPTIRSAGSATDDARSVFRREMGMNGDVYPADAAAALHIIRMLIESNFDVSAVGSVDGTSGFGHAFTWVLGRLLRGTTIRAVPVLVNTYFPPNQPTPKRCLELGRTLRHACESLPGDRRVVVIASGGLSHFTVNAELDETVLKAIGDHDVKTLEALPPQLLNSGTSEIRNWIAMSGSSDGLTCRWIEYQPVYRTAAGTGCGLAFALLS
jgi:3-O-methylgallate 3,4-dioxygenase